MSILKASKCTRHQIPHVRTFLLYPIHNYGIIICYDHFKQKKQKKHNPRYKLQMKSKGKEIARKPDIPIDDYSSNRLSTLKLDFNPLIMKLFTILLLTKQENSSICF